MIGKAAGWVPVVGLATSIGLAAFGCEESTGPGVPGGDRLRLQAGADASLLDDGTKVTSAWIDGDSLHVAFFDVVCLDSLAWVSPIEFEDSSPPRLPVYIIWRLKRGACITVIVPGTRVVDIRPAISLYRARYGVLAPFDLLLLTPVYQGNPESTLVRIDP